MLRRRSRKPAFRLASVSAFLMCAVVASQQASAAGVRFDVLSGTFAGEGALSSSANKAKYQSGNNTVTLSFVPAPGIIKLGEMSEGQSRSVVFGAFKVKASGGAVVSISDDFSLDLSALSPVIGQGSATARMSGEIKGGSFARTKTLSMSLESFSIPAFGDSVLFFEFNPITGLSAKNGKKVLTGKVTLRSGVLTADALPEPEPGTPPEVVANPKDIVVATPIPVPPAVWSGAAVLALLSAGAVLRRRAHMSGDPA